MIAGAWAPVDDDIWRTALGRHQWNRGGGIDRQRRAECEDQVGLDRGRRGPFEIRRSQRLAEADRCRLQDAAAGAARWPPRGLETNEMRPRLARGVTGLALHEKVGAMQFDEQLRRRACAAMKTVDVLRHDGEDLARLLERDHRFVHGVGPRALID